MSVRPGGVTLDAAGPSSPLNAGPTAGDTRERVDEVYVSTSMIGNRPAERAGAGVLPAARVSALVVNANTSAVTILLPAAEPAASS